VITLYDLLAAYSGVLKRGEGRMADVIGLDGKASTKGAAPVPRVVAALKELLARAEAGQVRQLAVVYVDGAGCPIDLYAPGGPPHELMPVIAGLELCKATLLKQMA